MGKIEKGIDYKKHDKGMSYYAERLELAEGLGFKFVSEAIHKLYIGGSSLSVISCMIDYKPGTVWQHLENMGVKRRPRGGSTKTNKSGVSGVAWIEKSQKWHVYYTLNGKSVYLGYLLNFIDAVILRRKAEIKYNYTFKSTAEAYLKKNGIKISE